MVDGLGRYCDICSSMKNVTHYHSVDLDICDKCVPYFKDMLERQNNNEPIQSSSEWRPHTAGQTKADNN